MSLGYDYALNRASVEVWNGLPRRSREQLLEFFRGLAERPFRAGDYRERDAAGAPIEAILVDGQFFVRWHVDHAAKEVRVFEIEVV